MTNTHTDACECMACDAQAWVGEDAMHLTEVKESSLHEEQPSAHVKAYWDILAASLTNQGHISF